MEGHKYLRTHHLAAEHMVLDLGEALTELHGQSASWQSRGAITLVKEGGMSLVLTHLHAGATMQEHAAQGPATVQVLDGHVRMQVEDETIDVPAGRVVAFMANVRHKVEALEDSALLLTIVER